MLKIGRFGVGRLGARKAVVGVFFLYRGVWVCRRFLNKILLIKINFRVLVFELTGKVRRYREVGDSRRIEVVVVGRFVYS